MRTTKHKLEDLCMRFFGSEKSDKVSTALAIMAGGYLIVKCVIKLIQANL